MEIDRVEGLDSVFCVLREVEAVSDMQQALQKDSPPVRAAQKPSCKSTALCDCSPQHPLAVAPSSMKLCAKKVAYDLTCAFDSISWVFELLHALVLMQMLLSLLGIHVSSTIRTTSLSALLFFFPKPYLRLRFY